MGKQYRLGAAFFCIVLFFTGGPFLHADQDTVQFEKVLDLKQQLDGAFLKDRDGFIWMGSTGGLFRYDGHDLKLFKAGSNGLSGNWVMAIVEDKEGVLWIGTASAGMTRYDKGTNEFTHFKHSPNDLNGLSNNSIPYSNQSLCVDRAGILWVSTQGGGLNRYDKTSQTFRHFRHDPKNSNSISSNKATAVIEDREGMLWIGTENAGLNRYDRKTGTWSHFRHMPNDENSLSDDFVQSIWEDKEGYLWVGTKKSGLNRFDRISAQWKHYTYKSDDPFSIGSNSVSYIYEDNAGVIWVCHERSEAGGSGLDRFDKETEQFQRYQNNPNDSKSISSNSIASIFQDKETGIYWIMNSLRIIEKIDKKSLKFLLWQHIANMPNSISANGVTEIYEDSRNAIWIGTYGGTLDRIDQSNGSFTHYAASLTHPGRLPYAWFPAILEDSSGGFWVASKNILALFNRDTGNVLKTYANDPKKRSSITRCDNIRSIIEDKDDPGILWIGTHGGGLDKFDMQKETFTHYKNNPADPTSLSHDIMRMIYDDGNGTLWVPTFNGLNKLDKKTGKFTRFFHDPSDPHSISSDFLLEAYRDHAGNLWFVGKGGLSRLDEKTGYFQNYGETNAFSPSNPN